MLALAACRAPREPEDGTRPEAVTEPTAQAEPTGGWRGFHGGVEKRVHAAAAWLDSFLSDERSLAENNRSWVALRGDYFTDQYADEDAGLHLGGRLVMPEFEDRLHIAFGGEPEEEVREETVGPGATPPPTVPGWSVSRARVRRVGRDESEQRTSLRARSGGAVHRVTSPAHPTPRGRYRGCR